MKKLLSIGFFTVILLSLFTACNLTGQTTDNPLVGYWIGDIRLNITSSSYTLESTSYSESGTYLRSINQVIFTPARGTQYTCIYNISGKTLTINYPPTVTEAGRPTGQKMLTKS